MRLVGLNNVIKRSLLGDNDVVVASIPELSGSMRCMHCSSRSRRIAYVGGASGASISGLTSELPVASDSKSSVVVSDSVRLLLALQRSV